MEDAATAEISRAQVWQWIHHDKGVLDDGRKVTLELFHELMRDELDKLEQVLGPEAYATRKFDTASAIFDRISTDAAFVDFLTLPAYEDLP